MLSDYITKPIYPEEVLARVNAHLKIQRLQQDLKKALKREGELNKLKSRFLSIASHEFRSPLMAIQITTNTLKRHGERMPIERKTAGEITDAVEAMKSGAQDYIVKEFDPEEFIRNNVYS